MKDTGGSNRRGTFVARRISLDDERTSGGTTVPHRRSREAAERNLRQAQQRKVYGLKIGDKVALKANPNEPIGTLLKVPLLQERFAAIKPLNGGDTLVPLVASIVPYTAKKKGS